MSEVNVSVGNPWTNVRYFSTFEEANEMRTSLKSRDTSGTLQVKVKRCGVSGTMYVVKSRQSADMVRAETEVDEVLEQPKATKKTRKAKK